MGKTSNKSKKKYNDKTYDYIKLGIRKDAIENKEYLLQHWKSHGYNSMNDFIICAIKNQIQKDINK